jgi:D-alanyl-D-alanine carboxypeptidase
MLKTLKLAAWATLVSAGLATGVGTAGAATSAAIVVDAKTGKVLYSDDADARCYPASLTKMMTLYLLFEALDSGKTSLNTRITVSAHAAAQAPSKLGLKPGQTIAVKDAILALVTKSANDMAVAVAEHLAGSEGAFAARMTAKARSLGMSRTTFRNASGLPNPGQVTTARDMATLGRALQEHYPKYYAYFSTKSFVYGGRRIATHNRLLGRVAGVNGIKTGYTRASGFNLVTSVNRNKRLLVAVVLGGKSGRARDQRMASLIEDYLPRASSGAKTVAMVPGKSGAPAIAAAEVQVADAAPMPQPKPRMIDPHTPPVTASLVGANSAFAAEATDEEEEGEGDVEDAPVAAAKAPVKFAVTVKPVPRATEKTLAPVVVASVDDDEPRPESLAALIDEKTEGWKIQLAATPSKEAATKILKNARAKASKLLASTEPLTQAVAKGDVTLYRARFVGFDSQQAARAACDYLVKKDFSCLALSD